MGRKNKKNKGRSQSENMSGKNPTSKKNVGSSPSNNADSGNGSASNQVQNQDHPGAVGTSNQTSNQNDENGSDSLPNVFTTMTQGQQKSPSKNDRSGESTPTTDVQKHQETDPGCSRSMAPIQSEQKQPDDSATSNKAAPKHQDAPKNMPQVLEKSPSENEIRKSPDSTNESTPSKEVQDHQEAPDPNSCPNAKTPMKESTLSEETQKEDDDASNDSSDHPNGSPPITDIQTHQEIQNMLKKTAIQEQTGAKSEQKQPDDDATSTKAAPTHQDASTNMRQGQANSPSENDSSNCTNESTPSKEAQGHHEAPEPGSFPNAKTPMKMSTQSDQKQQEGDDTSNDSSDHLDASPPTTDVPKQDIQNMPKEAPIQEQIGAQFEQKQPDDDATSTKAAPTHQDASTNMPQGQENSPYKNVNSDPSNESTPTTDVQNHQEAPDPGNSPYAKTPMKMPTQSDQKQQESDDASNDSSDQPNASPPTTDVQTHQEIQNLQKKTPIQEQIGAQSEQKQPDDEAVSNKATPKHQDASTNLLQGQGKSASENDGFDCTSGYPPKTDVHVQKHQETSNPDCPHPTTPMTHGAQSEQKQPDDDHTSNKAAPKHQDAPKNMSQGQQNSPSISDSSDRSNESTPITDVQKHQKTSDPECPHFKTPIKMPTQYDQKQQEGDDASNDSSDHPNGSPPTADVQTHQEIQNMPKKTPIQEKTGAQSQQIQPDDDAASNKAAPKHQDASKNMSQGQQKSPTENDSSDCTNKSTPSPTADVQTHQEIQSMLKKTPIQEKTGAQSQKKQTDNASSNKAAGIQEHQDAGSVGGNKCSISGKNKQGDDNQTTNASKQGTDDDGDELKGGQNAYNLKHQQEIDPCQVPFPPETEDAKMTSELKNDTTEPDHNSMPEKKDTNPHGSTSPQTLDPLQQRNQDQNMGSTSPKVQSLLQQQNEELNQQQTTEGTEEKNSPSDHSQEQDCHSREDAERSQDQNMGSSSPKLQYPLHQQNEEFNQQQINGGAEEDNDFRNLPQEKDYHNALGSEEADIHQDQNTGSIPPKPQDPFHQKNEVFKQQPVMEETGRQKGFDGYPQEKDYNSAQRSEDTKHHQDQNMGSTSPKPHDPFHQKNEEFKKQPIVGGTGKETGLGGHPQEKDYNSVHGSEDTERHQDQKMQPTPPKPQDPLHQLKQEFKQQHTMERTGEEKGFCVHPQENDYDHHSVQQDQHMQSPPPKPQDPLHKEKEEFNQQQIIEAIREDNDKGVPLQMRGKKPTSQETSFVFSPTNKTENSNVLQWTLNLGQKHLRGEDSTPQIPVQSFQPHFPSDSPSDDGSGQDDDIPSKPVTQDHQVASKFTVQRKHEQTQTHMDWDSLEPELVERKENLTQGTGTLVMEEKEGELYLQTGISPTNKTGIWDDFQAAKLTSQELLGDEISTQAKPMYNPQSHCPSDPPDSPSDSDSSDSVDIVPKPFTQDHQDTSNVTIQSDKETQTHWDRGSLESELGECKENLKQSELVLEQEKKAAELMVRKEELSKMEQGLNQRQQKLMQQKELLDICEQHLSQRHQLQDSENQRLQLQKQDIDGWKKAVEKTKQRLEELERNNVQKEGLLNNRKEELLEQEKKQKEKQQMLDAHQKELESHKAAVNHEFSELKQRQQDIMDRSIVLNQSDQRLSEQKQLQDQEDKRLQLQKQDIDQRKEVVDKAGQQLRKLERDYILDEERLNNHKHELQEQERKQKQEQEMLDASQKEIETRKSEVNQEFNQLEQRQKDIKYRTIEFNQKVSDQEKLHQQQQQRLDQEQEELNKSRSSLKQQKQQLGEELQQFQKQKEYLRQEKEGLSRKQEEQAKLKQELDTQQQELDLYHQRVDKEIKLKELLETMEQQLCGMVDRQSGMGLQQQRLDEVQSTMASRQQEIDQHQTELKKMKEMLVQQQNEILKQQDGMKNQQNVVARNLKMMQGKQEEIAKQQCELDTLFRLLLADLCSKCSKLEKKAHILDATDIGIQATLQNIAEKIKQVQTTLPPNGRGEQ